ncbi:MAG: DUF4097 family beta strand repeat-containing protein [Vicinamibacterales bacterium]
MLGALVLAAAPASAQADRRAARSPATDQTVPVQKGQRLQVQNFAGEVVVKAWNKDELRVVADHDSRAKVNIRSGGVEIHVSANRSGAPGSVAYTISVPTWLPVRIGGTYNFVSIEGTQSDVTVETTRGDVTLRGGSGVVSLKSIEGEILVEDAKGKLNLHTVNEGINIRGATGDITAETINGDIRMLGMKAASLEATTVNGDIIYEGTVADNLYRLSTHNGDITLALPENASASMSVRTYQGDMRSSFPIAEDAGEIRRGRRRTFTVGGGAAQIELESFGGDVRVRKIGEVSLEPKRKAKHEADHAQNDLCPTPIVVP